MPQKTCSFCVSGGHSWLEERGANDGYEWGVFFLNVKKSFGLIAQRVDGG